MEIANVNLDLPFLTTREQFALKLAADEKTIRTFIGARGDERLAMLPARSRLPLNNWKAMSSSRPRYVEQVGWFASVNDLANAMNWLLAKSNEATLGALRDILSVNSGVLVDSGTWHFAGFTRGSEPGVLTLTGFLTSVDARHFVAAAALNDPSRGIDERAALATLTKGIDLLAPRLYGKG